MPEQNLPRQLHEADRAFVVAAAGCGKTHAIAEAVSLSTEKRQLVLTHTHAGVAALRARLSLLGVGRDRYAVETIAGWCLSIAAAYPRLSGLPTPEPVGEQWSDVYGAARRAIQVRAIQSVLRRSYAGIYVDEYQDCVVAQHELIMALAELLPCRVLGDPLQGVFGFRGQRIVKWSTDVAPNFARLPDLTTPWRWIGHNEDLGSWLTAVRHQLLAGAPVDFSAAPVEWMPKDERSAWRACMGQLKHTDQSVVAIHKWPGPCHELSKTLRGNYTSMEEMDCKSLMQWAKAIGMSQGVERARELVSFAKECLTGVAKPTSSLLQALNRGAVPAVTKRCPAPDAYHAAALVASSNSWESARVLLAALRGIGKCPYRLELWEEMVRTIRAFERGGHETLEDAAWHVRDITRQLGRKKERRTVSRTLLVKGLEYDRALVLDAVTHDAQNIYVALTRGRKGAVVISESPKLTFEPAGGSTLAELAI